MGRCAVCSGTFEVVKALDLKYVELGGPLKRPTERKACSSCRKEISSFISKKVIVFNLVSKHNQPSQF
jgi:hypothetical protein